MCIYIYIYIYTYKYIAYSCIYIILWYLGPVQLRAARPKP